MATTLNNTPVIEVYTAILTAVGTADPTAVVLHNTMEGTAPVWTREGLGSYFATKTELTTTNTAILTQADETAFLTHAWPDSGGIALETKDISGSPADGMDAVTLEIRKYNNA